MTTSPCSDQSRTQSQLFKNNKHSNLPKGLCTLRPQLTSAPCVHGSPLYPASTDHLFTLHPQLTSACPVNSTFPPIHILHNLPPSLHKCHLFSQILPAGTSALHYTSSLITAKCSAQATPPHSAQRCRKGARAELDNREPLCYPRPLSHSRSDREGIVKSRLQHMQSTALRSVAACITQRASEGRGQGSDTLRTICGFHKQEL